MMHVREKKGTEEENQKWFAKEDLQDLAKIGSDFLKKTVTSGIDVIKDVKENLPKEASNILSRSKEEILKGLSQETVKKLLAFTVEKFFQKACEHRLEFSIGIRRKKNKKKKGKITQKRKAKH
jgi:hypothetical protein